jgi:hypothetical protein
MNDTITERDVDDDVGLEPDDMARVERNDQGWLKMAEGQTLHGAFLYFHSVDVNAVKVAMTTARKAGREPTRAEIKMAADKALDDHAKTLDKSAAHLTPDERLDLRTVQFRSFKAHHQEGLGVVVSRLGKDGPEADAIWKRLPEPRVYFSTLLLVYPTDHHGNIDGEASKRGEWRIIPWRFGPNTYDEIWNLNDQMRGHGMSIADQDIKLECKDATYQWIVASFTGNALWQSDSELRTAVLVSAMESYANLVPFREMSTHELRGMLGMGEGGRT